MKHVFSTIKAALLCGALVLGLSACGGSGLSSPTTATSASKAASWANVTIASGNKQVTLSWTDTTIAAGSTAPAPTYNIYYATAPGVKKNGTGVTKISNVTSPYNHTGLTNGTPYYYVVTAVSPAGVEGAESNEVSAAPQANKPAAPIGLQVQTGDGQTTLKLVEPTTGVAITPPTGTTYNVYWSQTGNPTLASNKIVNVTFSTTGFIHTGLTNSIQTSNPSTYYYAVTAQTVDGESDLSSPVSVTLWPATSFAAKNAVFTNASTSTSGQPSIPANLTAYAGNQQATLSWAASAGPTGAGYFKTKSATILTDPWTYSSDASSTKIRYNISWTSALLGTSGKIIGVSSTAFVHQALNNGTQYCYTVSAVATPSDSNTFLPAFESTTVLTKTCVTPTAKTPAVPAGLTAATGGQQVALSWNKDKSGYANVYYNVYASSTAGIDVATMVNNPGKYRLTSTTSNSFVHSGLTTGTTYYYTVTSVAEGESAPSSLVTATP